MEINININVAESYEERLQKAREKVLGSNIAKELQFMMVGNDRYQQICDKITSITGKPVWEDFNFKSGKILGILRTIAQNPKQRKELLAATGLNDAVIEMYTKYCGNLPYLDSHNIINQERPMDVEATKQFIPLAGSMLGLFVDELDLNDITETRWNKLCDNALKRAEETQEFNLKNKEENYEE